MNPSVIAPAFLATCALITVAAVGLVNTEAGTFRCSGSVVHLDRHGFPSSGEPGSPLKPCDPIVQVGETI